MRLLACADPIRASLPRAAQASLKGLEEGSAGYEAALEGVYTRASAKALEVARQNGGVYNKAAQFVASMQGGGGDKVVPKVFIDTLAILTDRAPFRPLGPFTNHAFLPEPHAPLCRLSNAPPRAVFLRAGGRRAA